MATVSSPQTPGGPAQSNMPPRLSIGGNAGAEDVAVSQAARSGQNSVKAGSSLVAGSASQAELAGADAGQELAADQRGDALALTPALTRLPVGLSVAIPVREFRVRNLLAMSAGAIIETQWGHGEDLPLASGGVQLAWSEFEVVDTRLAVRVTRLA